MKSAVVEPLLEPGYVRVRVVMGDNWGELVEEGGQLLCELTRGGYDDVLQQFAHTAVGFLENLATLHDALNKVAPQLSGTDLPVLRFEHDVSTGVLVARCVYAWADWRPMLLGLIQAAFARFDGEDVDIRERRQQVSEQGFITEFEITSKTKASGKSASTEQAGDDVTVALTDGIPRMSPATFCKVLPFHFMLDWRMVIVQVGHALARVMRSLRLNRDRFNDRFEMVSPALPADFDTLRQWREIPCVIRYVKNKTKLRAQVDKGSLGRCYSNPTKGQHPSHSGDVTLRGQMTYIAESERLLFLGSPLVESIDGLSRQGLFLSDIPLHDGTRDLLLLNEQLQVLSHLL